MSPVEKLRVPLSVIVWSKAILTLAAVATLIEAPSSTVSGPPIVDDEPTPNERAIPK